MLNLHLDATLLAKYIITQKLQMVMTKEYVQIFSKYLCKFYQMTEQTICLIMIS